METGITFTDLDQLDTSLMKEQIKESCDRMNADIPIKTNEERLEERIAMVSRFRRTFY